MYGKRRRSHPLHQNKAHTCYPQQPTTVVFHGAERGQHRWAPLVHEKDSLHLEVFPPCHLAHAHRSIRRKTSLHPHPMHQGFPTLPRSAQFRLLSLSIQNNLSTASRLPKSRSPASKTFSMTLTTPSMQSMNSCIHYLLPHTRHCPPRPIRPSQRYRARDITRNRNYPVRPTRPSLFFRAPSTCQNGHSQTRSTTRGASVRTQLCLLRTTLKMSAHRCRSRMRSTEKLASGSRQTRVFFPFRSFLCRFPISVYFLSVLHICIFFYICTLAREKRAWCLQEDL